MPHTLKALLFVATFALLTVSAQAQGSKKTSNASAPFTGVWDTVAGGGRFKVQLKQIGKKVTGTYSPYNGKIFGGVVTGNRVEFKWSQDGGAEGIGEFTLNADRKGFTGTSTMIKPTPQTNTWNTYVPAPPQSFAGTWDMVNNVGIRIPLTIVQKGAKVTGLYPARNGKLEGTVDGMFLRFTWESDEGSGSGVSKVSASGETFSVTFKKDNGQEIAGSPWWGERTSRGKGGDGGANASDAEIIGGSGGKMIASFAGTWTVTENGAGGTMEIKQFGSNVTGAYASNRGNHELKSGRVNGNTLRFALDNRTATSAASTAELVMDPGGKSFKGHIGGVTVTGKLKNP